MRESFYNIFFTFESKKIAYNCISDDFLILEPFLYELFQASIKEEKLEELKEIHYDFYTALLEKGFIIENSINELEEIKKISYETDFNNKNFSLIINPTMNCNFKCWYCYETHIKNSKLSETNVERIISFIKNTIDNSCIKKFSLHWFGGEPLLYFNKTILPLLEQIYPIMKEKNIQFSSACTSNGLLITQQLLNSCLKYGISHFQITLDGHRDRHNKVRFITKNIGSYDKIISNIKLCLKNRINVTTRINISEETIEDLLKIIDDFEDISIEEKKLITFSFHKIWQEEKNINKDISNIVDAYRAKGLRTAYIGENNASIRNSCYADKINQAVINYNGDVFKCTARNYDTSSREGFLEEEGKIIWNKTFQKRLYETRFKNKPCLTCKILPICNGGCSQHRVENENKDYCIFDFDEDKKIEIVKEKFYSRLHNKK